MKNDNTIRLKKEPFMASFSNLYDKDLSVVEIYTYKFASGTVYYYKVYFDGERYDIREEFVDIDRTYQKTKEEAYAYTMTDEDRIAWTEIWRYISPNTKVIKNGNEKGTAYDWSVASVIPKSTIKKLKTYLKTLDIYIPPLEYNYDHTYSQKPSPVSRFPELHDWDMVKKPFIAFVNNKYYYVHSEKTHWYKNVAQLQIDSTNKDALKDKGVLFLKQGGNTPIIHPKASQAPAEIWKYMGRKAGDWSEAPSIPSRLVKENKAYFDALPIFNFDFILDDYYPDYNYPYDPFPDSLQINVNGDPFIAVVGTRSYYIDPQGYDYARYIGEIDGYEKDERAIVIMGEGGNTAKRWEYTIGGL